MPHRRIEHIFAFTLSIMGLVGCGSSSQVPDVSDASPPDAAAPDANACTCPGTELLSRQHLIDKWGFIRRGGFSEAVSCERETDLILTGGCSFLDPGILDEMAENMIGDTRNYWFCTRHSVDQALDIAVRCVRPLDRTDELPEDCSCPAVETPATRVFYKPQALVVPAEGVGGVDVTCPAGSTLIGGGCQGGHSGFSGDALIIGAGIRPDDPQTWHCSWHVPGDRDLSSSAVAICLNAPGPDAVTGEPVDAEVIEPVSVEETLAANSTRIVEATCPPGDTLLGGGCHVEAPDTSSALLRLTRGSMLPPQDNRPNTWQCAWRNPTASTPRVIATATCLKPTATTRNLQ